MITPFIVNRLFLNHLWQSSCFALLAGLLAFVLRRNSPKVRYWVWLSASLKFLAPFALLVSLGSLVPRPDQHSVSVAAPVFPNALVQIAQPFSPAFQPVVPVHAPLGWAPVAIGVVWALGFLAIILARGRSWLRVRAVLRAGTPVELPISVPALITPGAEEPGVVGFLRPVLVLPARLLEHLNSRQLGAILTHELCHVRRRDNFFAAVHMLVEAIFWFNPLVWWIGSRMVEERELACDEEVLRAGCEPAEYVEGILKVCRFYTESPLPCISGVTGADVKKRLRAILTGSIARELTVGNKIVLAAIGLAVLSAPIVIGVLNAPAIHAQNAPANTPKFEVASIRPCQPPPQMPGAIYPPRGSSSPGSLRTGCYPLQDPAGFGLIRNAYTSFADRFTPIIGGPSWIDSAFYEIDARAEGNPSVAMMRGPMLQGLLEDRFHLKIHRQTTDGPVYFLSVARGGPKLHPFTKGSCTPYSSDPPAALQPGEEYCRSNIGVIPPASVEMKGATLDEFSKLLLQVLDRPVINKTGVTGRFDIRVEFSPEGTKMASKPLMVGGVPVMPPAASDPTGPASIFTALEEQLGLRLESGKGPVETLVIDHIERPTPN